VITGLVMAGGRAAALKKPLTIAEILLIATAVVAAWVATFRLASIVELVAWAFSRAGASFSPALVMGIWWRCTDRAGAVAGMIAGLAVTLVYMIGSRFYGLSWFGTQTIASAIFGLPVGFLVTWMVSLLSEPPPKALQDLVVSVRYPKAGQAVS
jgi:cation/acetate symporter